jgi:hypothetical protein
MEDLELQQQGAAAPGAGAAAGQVREVKLPQFWAARPAAWFTLAESRFRLKSITEEQQLFDHLLSALGDDIIAGILDAIEEATRTDAPYTQLKARLLETHVLSDFEKLERLFRCEPMGGRKPSELLSEMLQFCPDGKEKDIFFHFLYLQRLPTPLRSMLGDVQPGDPRALAARADRLLALNPHAQALIAAAVEEQQSAPIAAVAQGRPFRGRGGRNNNQQRPRGGGQSSGNTAAAKNPSPASLARESSGLCFFHWKFGDKANRCETPCSWQGN